jgi:hypothetical protein
MTEQPARPRAGKFVIAVAIASACAAGTPAQGAATSGTIAVLDFTLPVKGGSSEGVRGQFIPLDTSDDDVDGTLNAFLDHGTPLRSDGSPDLRLIRMTTAAMSNVAISMHRRGASSKAFPKKSYALEFKSTQAPFLEPGRDWALHSCYADATCLRNVLAYWQASQLFPWAPRTEFAEVFINGYYRGLYVVIEKIKLAPNRVNLSPPTDSRPSGGYILERQPASADVDVAGGSSNTFWSLVAPKRKEVTVTQYDYITRFMNAFERKFNPGMIPDYDADHYGLYLHERSAVDFILSQELSRNVDGYAKSMYVTKHPSPVIIPGTPPKQPLEVRVEQGSDSLVHMGPVWDFDLAYGNFFDHGYSVCDAGGGWRIEQHPPVVYQPLWETWKQPAFRRAVSDRWRTLRANGTISTSRTEAQIDAFASRIAATRSRDNWVWKNLETIDVTRRASLVNPTADVPWPLWECRDYSMPTTFQAEVAKLKQFVRARIDWMDSNIADPGFLSPSPLLP